MPTDIVYRLPGGLPSVDGVSAEELIIRILRDDRVLIRKVSDGTIRVETPRLDYDLSISGDALDVDSLGNLSGVVKEIDIRAPDNGGFLNLYSAVLLEGTSQFLMADLPQSLLGASGPVNYANYRSFFDLIGRDGAETRGTKAEDVVFSGGAADTVKTLGGNDTIISLTVADVLGGAGRDLVDFSKMALGVVAQLDTGLLLDRGGSEGSLSGVENLKGSKFDDTLTGNGKKNNLDGGKGDDTLNGKGGRDALNGGKGKDTLNGDGGNDTLKGQGGADVLNGGAGKNTLTGGKGSDTFIFTGAATEDVVTDYNRQQDELIFQGLTEDDIASITFSGNDSIVEIAPDGQDTGIIIFRDEFIAISDFGFD